MKKDLIEHLREEFEHGKTVRKLSADYLQFLKEEVEKKSFYENFCIFCSSIIKINLDDEKSKELQQKLDFSNLKISASDVYSAFVVTLLFTAIIFTSSFIALLSMYTVGEIIKYVSVITIIGVSLSYYVLVYPNIYAKRTRVDASSEIVQAILYMSIGLKNVPNLESAVAFAAFNLDGPLGRDLRKLLWDVYTGKYNRIEDGLDDFSRKWKFENREFSQAIDLLKTSVNEIYERDKVIERAINLILQSNMERMNQYARDLKNPITMINALGILLPVITLMIFPILGLIMPTLVSSYTLVVMYNIALPLSVYFLMKNVLDKRPYGFHAVDIKNHPEASGFGEISFKISKKKVGIPLLPFCIVVFLLISFPAIIGMTKTTIDTPLFTRTLYGLQVFWGAVISIIIFTLMSTTRNKKIKKELEEIESEFSEAIFMLGSTLRAGQPFEASLKSTSQRLKDQKIHGFFEKIITKMNNLGVSLKDAVFNKEYGVIREYPSKTIKNTMKIVVESTSKGLGVTASTLTAISQYMKNVHEVDEHLKQLLEDVTSSMGIMASLLVPLAAGVVVGLSGIIMKILIFIASLFAQLPSDQTDIPILNINPESIMPVEIMILVVGFYMIELIISLNIFKVKIERGNDIYEIGYSIGTNLISAALIFTFAILIIAFGLGALIPLSV